MAAHGRMKYYVLNKESDYRKGFFWQMEYRQNGLQNLDNVNGRCLFISGLYDGRERGCIWHRMAVEGLSRASVPMTFRFYASDEPFLWEDGTARDIKTLIGLPGEEMSIEEKLRLFEPCLCLETQGASSILLHQVSGRYMWFTVSAYCPPGETAGFDSGIIYFPKETWINYLPEIYSQDLDNDSFLERYLSIFQTLYDELGRKIDTFPLLLDANAADLPMLCQLAGWLGIGCIGLWNEEQLRYLVANAHSLYRKRGTREGICAFIKLYTGEEPFIAEQHQIERFADDEAQYPLLRNLYGNDPGVFTVLLRASCMPTGKEFSDLQKIIEEVKPAWMDFKIITLRPYILLDSYSYLGINSTLGQYRPAELDGFSMLSFSTAGGQPEKPASKQYQ